VVFRGVVQFCDDAGSVGWRKLKLPSYTLPTRRQIEACGAWQTTDFQRPIMSTTFLKIPVNAENIQAQ
jgi:hypothetical protein